MNRYDSTTRINREIVKRHHDINFTSHVVVPFCISTVLTLAIAAAVLSNSKPYTPPPPIGFAFILWGIIFSGVLYIVLNYGGSIEIVTGYNLDVGLVDPPPEPKDPYQTKLDIDFSGLHDRYSKQTQFAQFKPEPATVARLFQMALDNDRRGDAIIPDNRVVKAMKIIGGDDWKEMMETLRSLGWAEYRNGHWRNGHDLTIKGKAAMEKWVEDWFMSNK